MSLIGCVVIELALVPFAVIVSGSTDAAAIVPLGTSGETTIVSL